MSNRAVVLQTWVANNPDAGLALVTKPVPEAQPGQVVVHIILRPVNPTDLMPYRNQGYAHAKDGSYTPGSEGVGIVHDVGEGVTTVVKGQRVVPLVQVENVRKGQGTWQEYVAVRGDLVLGYNSGSGRSLKRRSFDSMECVQAGYNPGEKKSLHS
ncbi:unnamed protein product [Sphagnum balticum]